jgi:DNA repair exonuclease SbcCD ATPase subunit
MPDTKLEKLMQEVERLKERVRGIEDSLSGKTERQMGDVISSLGTHKESKLPTLEDAIKQLQEHQMQTHGRVDAKLSGECPVCFYHEFVYYMVAKKAGALPFDPEAPR